jgi:hypothetical protein
MAIVLAGTEGDGKVTNIDQLAYASKLKQQNPMEKYSDGFNPDRLFGSKFSAGFDRRHINHAWLTVAKGGAQLGVYLKLMFIPLSFLVIGSLTIAVQTGRSPQEFLFSFKIFDLILGVSKASLWAAAGSPCGLWGRYPAVLFVFEHTHGGYPHGLKKITLPSAFVGADEFNL